MSNVRKYYLDFLRIFSCILIVMVHVSANQFEVVSPRTFDWQIMNFYDCLGILGVPLFVMISGALLLDSSHNLPTIKLLKKAGKLAFLYFFWLGIYNFITYLGSHASFTFPSFKQEVLLNSLLGKGIYHLWFLPMLIALYLIIPLLKPIVSSKESCKYFLILYFIIALFFPTIFKYDFPYRTILMSIYEKTPFVMFTGYIGYFILGYYLAHHTGTLSKKSSFLLFGLGGLSFIITVFLCGYDGYVKNHASTIMNDPFTVFSFFSCMAVFLAFKQLFICSEIIKHTLFWTELSGLSFGVYLLHPLLIWQMDKLNITTMSFSPVISIPVITLAIALLCGMIAYLFKKFPFFGKWLRFLFG